MEGQLITGLLPSCCIVRYIPWHIDRPFSGITCDDYHIITMHARTYVRTYVRTHARTHVRTHAHVNRTLPTHGGMGTSPVAYLGGGPLGRGPPLAYFYFVCYTY